MGLNVSSKGFYLDKTVPYKQTNKKSQMFLWGMSEMEAYIIKDLENWNWLVKVSNIIKNKIKLYWCNSEPQALGAQ